jgi:hypothetical protein
MHMANMSTCNVIADEWFPSSGLHVHEMAFGCHRQQSLDSLMCRALTIPIQTVLKKHPYPNIAPFS